MMRRKLLIAAMVAVLGVAAAATTAAAITGAPAGTASTPVDVTNDVYANNEESLGMSPNGQLLAGAWNDWEFNDGCGFSYSIDGGNTWAPETFAPFTAFSNTPGVDPIFPTQFAVAGDPAVVFNPHSSKFDVICQAFGTATGNQIQLLSETFDPTKADPTADENLSYGAAAWTPPVAITTGKSNGSQKGSNGQFPDHEAAIVDTGTGPGHHFGRLFVAWAEFSGSGRSPIDIAYSDDDGAHWSGPLRISDQGNQFDQDAIPRVGPDGTVYVSWINGPNEKSLKNNVAMIDKSTDGGATWGTDQVAAPVVSPIGGLLPNSNYRVFEDVHSTVDQQTGRVVLTYTDQKSGASNIYATHNLVAGDITQWSTPAAVKPSADEQFFPWMSSAPNGRVDLVFYDRTCDPSDDKLNCVTLASTSDDGASWGYTTLQPTPFDGDLHHTCLAPGDPEACGRNFLGDYIAVASTNAKAQALWTGNGSRGMDVFSGRATFVP
jgi:hypothetical protein